jgi:hypothetical protein
MRGWLKGTALTYLNQHMMDQSGHLVWKDMVDKFLSRTPEKQHAIGLELRNVQHDTKESLPQFFARVRNTQAKFLAVGGFHTEQALVQDISSALRQHSKFKAAVDTILKVQPGADSFDLESKLMQHLEIDKATAAKAGTNRTHALLSHAHVQQAIAHVEANLAEPRRDAFASRPSTAATGAPRTYRRPWEQQQRHPYDKSGIGSNTPRKPPAKQWQNWKGGDKSSALAQLQEDFHAQVAAVEQSFGPGTSPPAEDAASNVFEQGLQQLSTATSNVAETDPFMSFAFEAPGDVIHVVLSSETQHRLVTPNSNSDDPTMDSGTTHNIWTDREDFDSDFTPCCIPITHAGNKTINAEGRGTVTKQLALPSGRSVLHKFPNSLFVPGASRNLISTTELEDQGHEVRFKKGESALILSSDIRVPLRSSGRLRTLPLHRPAAPLLRQGWQPLPPAGDEQLAHLLASKDNRHANDSDGVNPDSTAATPSGWVHPSRTHLFKSNGTGATKRPSST